jgi:hypothetical protein
VVADIAKLSVGREAYYPASWPPTTRRTCPATGSPQAGGTALAPAAWGWRAKHRRRVPGHVRGPRPHHWRAAWPSAWPQRRPGLDVVLRPTKSVSVLYGWAIRPPAGRCSRHITGGWPRRSPTWTSTSGPAGGHGGVLAHLNSDPEQLLAGTDADRPVVAVRVRASVGRPGGSAQARWRQLRAAEWAAWTRSLPWRVAATLCVGTAGGVLAGLLAPRLSLVLGTVAAVVAGWGLWFRPSLDAVAWRRRGAAGGATHGPAARPAGAARLGGPARPGRPWQPG